MTRQSGRVVATWALAIVLAASTQSAAQTSLANAGAPQTSLANAGAPQESLASARQLYASADYKSALTMLNALLAESPSPQERQSIELYRTFCLVAIGNTDEANKAIEAMVSRDPLYRPNPDDVPPRLRTVFSDARKRLLPALIQERYIIAKTAFDRADYKSAAEGFTQVLIALSDPDIAPAVKQPPLADLRVLASGFSDLTVRALTPPPVPVVPLAPPVAGPTAAGRAASSRGSHLHAGRQERVAAGPGQAGHAAIYRENPIRPRRCYRGRDRSERRCGVGLDGAAFGAALRPAPACRGEELDLSPRPPGRCARQVSKTNPD